MIDFTRLLTILIILQYAYLTTHLTVSGKRHARHSTERVVVVSTCLLSESCAVTGINLLDGKKYGPSITGLVYLRDSRPLMNKYRRSSSYNGTAS